MNSMKSEKMEVARVLRQNQTLAEKTLWEQLRAKKLMGLKFRRQHPLKGYVVDFYCHKINLVIEIDGSIHDNNGAKDDFRQREIMVKTGASFLRFTNDDVLFYTQNVIETISTKISEKTKRA